MAGGSLFAWPQVPSELELAIYHHLLFCRWRRRWTLAPGVGRPCSRARIGGRQLISRLQSRALSRSLPIISHVRRLFSIFSLFLSLSLSLSSSAGRKAHCKLGAFLALAEPMKAQKCVSEGGSKSASSLALCARAKPRWGSIWEISRKREREREKK